MKLQRYTHSSSGFTLMELLVVISIAMVLMGIAIPSFLSWLPTLRLSSAARQVATDLQIARMRAISRNATNTVTFNTVTGTYTSTLGVVGESRDIDQLYPGITISVVSANPAFTARGTASPAGNITLSNGSATKQVQVNAIGRVIIP
jgi:type IV fimbrial biogenesis protein FimT